MITTIPDRERTLQAEVDALTAENARLREQEHIAWVRFQEHPNRPTTIHLCDSDHPRALKVCAAPPAQPADPTIDEQVASVNAVFDAWRNGEDATLTLGLAAQPAKPLPLVQATAPREIWLQVSEDADSDGEAFPTDTFDVSWCDTQIMACEVPYVRADLAAQPAHPEEFRCPLCFDDPANIKPAEPVQRLSDEQIDAILHEAGVDEFAAIPIEYDRQVARAIESALQPGWRPEWPAFVEYWTHESHLQTFADRERFRAAAKAMLEAAPKATK